MSIVITEIAKLLSNWIIPVTEYEIQFFLKTILSQFIHVNIFFAFFSLFFSGIVLLSLLAAVRVRRCCFRNFQRSGVRLMVLCFPGFPREVHIGTHSIPSHPMVVLGTPHGKPWDVPREPTLSRAGCFFSSRGIPRYPTGGEKKHPAGTVSFPWSFPRQP